MFKKTFPIALFLISALVWAEESKPSILLLPLENNRAEETQFRAISNTVDDTLSLSLQLLGKYLVLTPDEETPSDEAELYDWAADKGIDNVVSGAMSVSGASSIDFSVILYDPIAGKVKDEVDSSAAGILGVFDATDELVMDLLGSFSDSHVGFGKMVFNPSGSEGDYKVFLNGVSLGENAESVDRILIGDYDLTILQRRFGESKIIYADKVTVEEFETAAVDFSIPDLLPEEKSLLDRRYEELLSLYDLKTVDLGVFEDDEEKEKLSRLYAADSEVNRSGDILENVIGDIDALELTDALSAERDRFAQREALWRLRKEWWGLEESPRHVSAARLDDTVEIFVQAASFFDPASIREAADLNGRLFARLAVLNAALAFNEGDVAGGLAIYEDLLETGRALGSETGFGYSGEYDELKEVADNPEKSERWKKRRIAKLTEKRIDFANDLFYETFRARINANDKQHTVFVWSENPDHMLWINGSRAENPYQAQTGKNKLDYRYGKRRFENEKIEMPVYGRYAMSFVPHDDPEALSSLKDGAYWKRFNLYAGVGGGLDGAWLTTQGEVRFFRGIGALALGFEPGFNPTPYAENPVAAVNFPLFIRTYPLVRKNFDLGAGLMIDMSTYESKELAATSNRIALTGDYVYKREGLDIFAQARFYGELAEQPDPETGEDNPGTYFALMAGIRF